MEPYILKCKGVLLGPMMAHLGITIDDLPKPAGGPAICYNFVLGRCVVVSCRNKDGHINATNVTDEFAAQLLDKLRPAVTHFIAHGPPPLQQPYRRRMRE